MPYKTDVCPYCDESYPHAGPTGCEPVTRKSARKQVLASQYRSYTAPGRKIDAPEDFPWGEAREAYRDEGGDSHPAGGMEPGGIDWQ